MKDQDQIFAAIERSTLVKLLGGMELSLRRDWGKMFTLVQAWVNTRPDVTPSPREREGIWCCVLLPGDEEEGTIDVGVGIQPTVEAVVDGEMSPVVALVPLHDGPVLYWSASYIDGEDGDSESFISGLDALLDTAIARVKKQAEDEGWAPENWEGVKP